MKKIAVLTGGSSAERLVAFAGAVNVVEALRSSGHDVVVVDTVCGVLTASDEARLLSRHVGVIAPDPEQLAEWRRLEEITNAPGLPAVRNADLVFLVVHGEQGEGGRLQESLESVGVPYTGTGPIGSAAAMNKDRAKRIFRSVGIPTADWVMWGGASTDTGRLGLPLVVKPSKVGSSLGLSVVQAAADLDRAVKIATRYDTEVMIEAYADGREFTVGVLGEKPLGVGEIIPSHGVFDYECKYTPGMSEEIFPAPLGVELEREIKRLALAAHRALGLRHFSRIDFKLAADGTPLCLEANTLPGLTGTSLFPQSAAVEGISFADLCLTIRDLALEPRTQEQPAPEDDTTT